MDPYLIIYSIDIPEVEDSNTSAIHSIGKKLILEIIMQLYIFTDFYFSRKNGNRK